MKVTDIPAVILVEEPEVDLTEKIYESAMAIQHFSETFETFVHSQNSKFFAPVSESRQKYFKLSLKSSMSSETLYLFVYIFQATCSLSKLSIKIPPGISFDATLSIYYNLLHCHQII